MGYLRWTPATTSTSASSEPGSFTRSTQIGAVLFKSQGATDAFLVKLKPDGEQSWAVQFGGTASDTILRVACDATGAIYVLGEFVGTSNFGGPPLTTSENASASAGPSGRISKVVNAI